MPKFVNNIDLNKNELQNARIQNLASAPSTPADGQIYFDTVSHQLMVWNATAAAWQICNDEGVASVSGTAPIVSSGGKTPAISINAATTSDAGSMSAADKTKLDGAASIATVSALVLRDAAGRAQVVAPSADADIATKGYVDGVAQGLDAKNSVRLASTAALTLTDVHDGLSLDGFTLATGQRVLLKNQAAPEENGIYVAAATGAPARATDADAWAKLVSAYVLIEEGTANKDTGWVCKADSGGTLGSTALDWVKFSSVAGNHGSTHAAGGTDPVQMAASDKLLGRATAGAGPAEEITCTAAARTFIGAADASAERGALGLGDSATKNVGTGAGEVAAGDHTHASSSLKYAAALAGGAASEDVTHNLGTRDMMVSVYAVDSPYAAIMCDYEMKTTNVITIKFAAAIPASTYRVVVVG